MRPGLPYAWPPRARAALRLWLGCVCFALVQAESLSAPVNVTVRHLKANSAVVSWDVLEDEVVIGFAISQQKKDVRMLRFIQEVNTTTRSCALWDLEEDTEYIVHVQAISIQGQSPASEPVLFKTPREAEKMASKNKDEVTMKEMGRNQQLRTGEVLIIVVVLFMWAGVIALFCRQYDIIKDNEPNNSKEKAKSASETSTPEHQGGGLLRSKVRAARVTGPWLVHWSSLDYRRGQLRAWYCCSQTEPRLASACVTQETLQIDFGFFPFAGCQRWIKKKKR
ncbi:fibronectin type III domain-containing protein 5 isoform X1 [Elephas maximus indicus]|uniref:fibronectin type III domain-containing protein 5 isoform X1 n=2 Tax=Elephas maximus indicus TaxID=99487 RepID=UPI002115EDE8|nr:fibronectin type III domain-containing protein 5 isoform X1 [Elephas maximus indicus]